MEDATATLPNVHPVAFLFSSLQRRLELYLLTQFCLDKGGTNVSEHGRILEKLKGSTMSRTGEAWLRRSRYKSREATALKKSINVLLNIKKLEYISFPIIFSCRVLKHRLSFAPVQGSVKYETSKFDHGNDEQLACDLDSDPYHRLRADILLKECRQKHSDKSHQIHLDLVGCCEDIQVFVETHYWNCILCSMICRKSCYKFFGIGRSFPRKDGTGFDQGFICAECVPNFNKICQAYIEQERQANELTSPPTPSSPKLSPTPVPVATSGRKMRSKKKKRTKPISNDGAERDKTRIDVRDINNSSPSTVLEFLDDLEARATAPPRPHAYPSNADLLTRLVETGSIVALNEYLDEFEGVEYEEKEIGNIKLDRSALEEFVNECLAVTGQQATQDIPLKSSMAALKGYTIASGMIAELEIADTKKSMPAGDDEQIGKSS